MSIEQPSMSEQNFDIEKKAQELLEETDSENRTRTYHGVFQKVLIVCLVAWSIFQLYYNTIGVMSTIHFRSWHILFLLCFTFVYYPAFKKEKRERKLPSIVDLLLIAATIFVYLYVVTQYDAIAQKGGRLTNFDLAVAIFGILLIFEAARRACPSLAVLGLIFMAYNFLGPYIPGVFGHTGFSLKRILSLMFWGSQGIFGVGIGVSATYIFLFVLFGAFLKHSGFSQFINDISLTLVGHSPGGPAKVAVLASALMGMINGSAIANVATTGTITIPLMKKTGYKAEFAAAVEAVASTGGQFCPPIMGAVGFVMAEFLGVSYTKVMLAACIPAFLYYLTLLLSVHFEAKKLGLTGLSKENIPNALEVLKSRGHLMLPLIVLLGMMFAGYTPLYAAVVSIFATIIASWFRKETRMTPQIILEATCEGAKGAVSVGVSCAIIGVIIGTVSLTGLGLTFGNLVLKVVGADQLFLGGFMVMVLSIILGMGVPGVAAYVIVAAVAVPVLIKIGASPLAAHMFCLIYACLSNITPPVAMSSYVASGIARSNQTKTSLIAVKLGLTGFIIPFFFLNNPLLLYGSAEGVPLWNTLIAFITSCIGVFCLSAGMEGWLLKACNWPTRILLILIGLFSIDPHTITDLCAIVLLAVILFSQKMNDKRSHVV